MIFLNYIMFKSKQLMNSKILTYFYLVLNKDFRICLATKEYDTVSKTKKSREKRKENGFSSFYFTVQSTDV